MFTNHYREETRIINTRQSKIHIKNQKMSGPNVSNSKISQAIDGEQSTALEITTDEIKENCDSFGNEMS